MYWIRLKFGIYCKYDNWKIDKYRYVDLILVDSGLFWLKECGKRWLTPI